jgi:hypothetical protein
MKNTYYDLSVHSRRQLIIFLLMLIVLALIFFQVFLPMLSDLIGDFLDGEVFNAGESVAVTFQRNSDTKETNFYTLWAIDTYQNTPQEMRYWISPIYSFSLPILMFSMIVSIVITTLLPRQIGYMRQKIEREITHALTKIAIFKEGRQNLSILDEIKKDLLNADLKQLHDMAEICPYTVEDLKVLKRSLIWIESNLLFKMLYINRGLTIYMRFYFAEKYSNTVLGLVYLGAAFLIIIIGLRGLKFIPSTQPSLVFLSLGLEFSMLLTYAFTLIFTRQEEEEHKEEKHHNEHYILSNNYGNDKQVENLLRVFIKKNENDKKD